MAGSSVDGLIQDIGNITAKRSFGSGDKVFFFKEMSYLLKGGVAIIDAVKTLNQSTDNLVLQQITHYIFQALDEGKSLTYALGRLPQYFTAGDVAIIKSGESSGKLPGVLASLASEYGFLHKVKKEYIGAMLYPGILLVMSVAAIIALFVFILPGLFGLVEQFEGAQIPLMTRILMQTSTFLQTQIVWILIGLIIVGLIASVIFSTPKGKSFLYSTIMQIPVFGDLTKSYRLIKFARYMKLMVGAGLNYVETFRLMREIMEAPLYKEMSTHVLHGLEQGESIFSRMEDFTDILPRDVLVLLKVGEETATLKESLDNVVDMYSEELELKIRSISKVIEPIMIIFVGGIVGMIAISVFGIIGSVLDALPSI